HIQLARLSTACRPQNNLELEAARSLVRTSETLSDDCVNARWATHKNCLRFVQRHRRLVNVALWVGREIHRPLAVLFVVGCIETIVVKVSHRKTNLVKLKLKLIVFQSDLQYTVSRMLVLADIVSQRVRGLGIGHAAVTGFAASLGACLLVP